jgi:poly [ADP-ribose] polymerase
MRMFTAERKGERVRYYPFSNINNRSTFKHNLKIELLWHGSRTNNFVGILTEGLRIAPPEAPSSGYMFGKGLYFADVPSKSA